ncbi:MAG: hypothetical protein ACLRYE_03920 [Gemmiger formicilis]|uniref:hypothetical protein n=1 Tax=Gemmiger formicilis TaxID=745368 RepID=UPI0039A1C956
MVRPGLTNTLGGIQPDSPCSAFTTAAVPLMARLTPGNAPAEPDPGPNTGNARPARVAQASTSTAAVQPGRGADRREGQYARSGHSGHPADG